MVVKKSIYETMAQWIERCYQFMLCGDMFIEQYPEEDIDSMDSRTFYNCVALMQANRIEYRKIKEKKNINSNDFVYLEKYKKNIIYFEGLVNKEIARVNAIMYCKYLEEESKRKERK